MTYSMSIRFRLFSLLVAIAVSLFSYQTVAEEHTEPQDQTEPEESTESKQRTEPRVWGLAMGMRSADIPFATE